MKNMRFTVEGMMCQGCSSGLEKQIRTLDGVITASVSLEEKLLTVEADELLTAEDIITAVTECGFEAAVAN